MQLNIKKKKVSEMPLLENPSQDALIMVVDGDENYKFPLSDVNGDVDKAYVDEQDGLRMLTSEYVGTGATKTVKNATTADTASYANNAGGAINDGSGRNISSTYQTLTDNNLQTVSKTVVGSINEVNDVAKGAQKAISKTNYSTLVTYLKSLPSDGLTIGQTIYIETLNVPDVWIFSKSVTFNDYIYVSDNQFITDVIDNNTIVGYFGLSKLETGKINLTDYVPYTGATKNVNLGDYNLNVNGLAIDTVTPYVVTNPGEIGWNASQGTFDIHLLNNTILQAGQELHIYAKAVGDISNGDVVQLIGSQGGHLIIKKAVQSEIIANPNLIIGISTENILNGNFGYVTNFGEINNVYTSGYTEGDSLYFNITGSTAGTFTNIKPNAPYPIIRLGSVLRAQTGNAENGKIGIRLTYSSKLSDLTDVNGTPLTTSGQILVWNNTKGVHDFTDNINNYASIVNSDAKYVAQNGGNTFHTQPWINTGTISSNGTTITGVGTSFTSFMVGAKIIVNGEERIISTYISPTSITINSSYSQNYSGVSFAVYCYVSKVQWTGGEYCPIFYTHIGGEYFLKSYDRIIFGAKISNGQNDGHLNFNDLNAIKLAGNHNIIWSSQNATGNADKATADTGIRREGAGLLSIYDGVTGSNYRDLKLRNIILANSLANQYYTIKNSTTDVNNLFLDIIPTTTSPNYQQTVSIKGQNARLTVENTNDPLTCSFVPTYGKFQFQANGNYVFFVQPNGVVASTIPTTNAYNTPRNYLDDGNGNMIVSNKIGIGTTTLTSTLQVNGDSKFGDSTNNTTIEADGTIKFNGTATVWDDVKFDALSLQQTGSGISVNTAESTVDYLTSANQADYMIASPQFPHAMKAGSNVFPHIHWTQTQANVPNFAIQYRWQINGGAKTTAWTAIKCNTTAFTYVSGSLNQICKPAAGITPPVGYNISDILQMRIIRDTTNALGLAYGADPYTATVGVLSVDVHCELDGFGSRTEYTK